MQMSIASSNTSFVPCTADANCGRREQCLPITPGSRERGCQCITYLLATNPPTCADYNWVRV